jgi:hypothetical protein
MNMDTEQEWWAEVDRLVKQMVKPAVKLVYKLYYDADTGEGQVISYEDLPGSFVVVGDDMCSHVGSDYLVHEGKIICKYPKVNTISSLEPGNQFYSLATDHQIACDALHEDSMGWQYVRIG